MLGVGGAGLAGSVADAGGDGNDTVVIDILRGDDGHGVGGGGDRDATSGPTGGAMGTGNASSSSPEARKRARSKWGAPPIADSAADGFKLAPVSSFSHTPHM